MWKIYTVTSEGDSMVYNVCWVSQKVSRTEFMFVWVLHSKTINNWCLHSPNFVRFCRVNRQLCMQKLFRNLTKWGECKHQLLIVLLCRIQINMNSVPETFWDTQQTLYTIESPFRSHSVNFPHFGHLKKHAYNESTKKMHKSRPHLHTVFIYIENNTSWGWLFRSQSQNHT